MKILVGFSGGVDSTGTIIILREQGFDPIAVTFIFNEFFEYQKTEEIARKLSVRLIKIDLRKEFEEGVIQKFIREYKQGKTPNVCGWCNREFKIKNLIQLANRMGIRWVATGHYSRILSIKGKRFIARAKYREKDQSYFLSLVSPYHLSRIVFLLGEYSKETVRQIVKDAGISIARDDESQDVCFIRGRFRDFMEKRIGLKPGQIIGPDGSIVGYHRGIQYYTIGQRRGLEVSLGRRIYVGEIDPESNRIILQEKEKIYRKFVKVKSINKFTDLINEEYLVQIRNVHKAAPARIRMDGDKILVEFREPQWAPTPGQIAAFYDNEILVAGGIIESSW